MAYKGTARTVLGDGIVVDARHMPEYPAQLLGSPTEVGHRRGILLGTTRCQPLRCDWGGRVGEEGDEMHLLDSRPGGVGVQHVFESRGHNMLYLH